MLTILISFKSWERVAHIRLTVHSLKNMLIVYCSIFSYFLINFGFDTSWSWLIFSSIYRSTLLLLVGDRAIELMSRTKTMTLSYFCFELTPILKCVSQTIHLFP